MNVPSAVFRVCSLSECVRAASFFDRRVELVVRRRLREAVASSSWEIRARDRRSRLVCRPFTRFTSAGRRYFRTALRVVEPPGGAFRYFDPDFRWRADFLGRDATKYFTVERVVAWCVVDDLSLLNFHRSAP